MPATAPNLHSPPLPQRVLLVETSRAFVQAVAQAIEQQLELPVTVASTLAEARAALAAHDDWFLVLTGLVLADGAHETVVDCFLGRELPTDVVRCDCDEDRR